MKEKITMTEKIQHPLKVGQKVKYLSPRCPCSGKKFVIVENIIVQVTNPRNVSNVTYRIKGERQQIPAQGIVQVI